MPLNTQLANATVEGQATDLATRLNTGYLRIYDGTQAATADTAVGAQVLLAELRFNATAAASVTGGLITFNSITADSSANASGTASWYRALSSNGTTVVMDGSVGTATSNLILNSVAISSGAAVSVSAFTHDVLNSSSGL